MATKKAAENDVGLPFPALQLLAPPVRLVSAALWKAVQRRDVLQYGAVEEFVTSVCDTVPGMLTFRHQGKLTLGLRGRLILELLNRGGEDQPDRELIDRQMERFRAPAPSPSAQKPKKDVKIEKTVGCFREMVETLLRDPAERQHFFTEEFPVEYGSKFDLELEKLLWEFLIRLDQLLPVPNLTQTVSWLSTAPPVLEECARAATQPQLLQTILQHQTCLGHLEVAASLPPNMGDSILTSLALPPSGRLPSNQPTGSSAPSLVKPSSPRTAPGANRARTKDEAPVTAPVVGPMSNKDPPATKRKARDGPPPDPHEDENVTEAEENAKFTSDARRDEDEDAVVNDDAPQEEGRDKLKRKQPESDGIDTEDRIASASASKRGRRGLRRRGGEGSGDPGRRRRMRRRRSRSPREGVAGDAESSGSESDPASALRRSARSSCLRNQPTVCLRRLDMASHRANTNSAASNPSAAPLPDEKSSTKSQKKPVSEPPGSSDKDHSSPIQSVLQPSAKNEPLKGNCHVLPGITSSPSNTEMPPQPGNGEDCIGDSEDEATKNFKRRLFVKRYYKTKHDTYVPTLREFWKPWMARKNLLSPGNGNR